MGKHYRLINVSCSGSVQYFKQHEKLSLLKNVNNNDITAFSQGVLTEVKKYFYIVYVCIYVLILWINMWVIALQTGKIKYRSMNITKIEFKKKRKVLANE